MYRKKVSFKIFERRDNEYDTRMQKESSERKGWRRRGRGGGMKTSVNEKGERGERKGEKIPEVKYSVVDSGVNADLTNYHPALSTSTYERGPSGISSTHLANHAVSLIVLWGNDNAMRPYLRRYFIKLDSCCGDITLGKLFRLENYSE